MDLQQQRQARWAARIAALRAENEKAQAMQRRRARPDADDPGLEARRQKASTPRNLDIVQRRKNGETLAEIGVRYKLSRERVRQIIELLGTKNQ